MREPRISASRRRLALAAGVRATLSATWRQRCRSGTPGDAGGASPSAPPAWDSVECSHATRITHVSDSCLLTNAAMKEARQRENYHGGRAAETSRTRRSWRLGDQADGNSPRDDLVSHWHVDIDAASHAVTEWAPSQAPRTRVHDTLPNASHRRTPGVLHLVQVHLVLCSAPDLSGDRRTRTSAARGAAVASTPRRHARRFVLCASGSGSAHSERTQVDPLERAGSLRRAFP